MIIKEIKETGGHRRVTFSKKELKKIQSDTGDYVKITKLEVENEDSNSDNKQ